MSLYDYVNKATYLIVRKARIGLAEVLGMSSTQLYWFTKNWSEEVKEMNDISNKGSKKKRLV